MSRSCTGDTSLRWDLGGLSVGTVGTASLQPLQERQGLHGYIYSCLLLHATIRWAGLAQWKYDAWLCKQMGTDSNPLRWPN